MTTVVQTESAFYVAGGNLMPGARSYVVRPADDELFEAIRDGHYSYVLTSRQMGKSSLMHRTAVRLEEAGIAPILIDLTGIGANLSVEQWYFGLLAEVGKQVGLTAEMERLWNDMPQHGPLYRFTRTLTEVALAKSDKPIAIFIDEIDFVRGLRNFSTDEFFAAIRQCYNSRASVPEMRRLTFCLLGVATPADLIRDVNTTPFNIGKQIELTDFTIDEALPLAPGLDPNPSMAIRKLQRIFDWTNGHPYLTQKLCLAASERRECPLSEIDRICHAMFLSSGVRRSEDNLIFVHNTLRNGTEDRTAVIGMYRRVLVGKTVSNDPADPVVALLRLAGVVRVENGRLLVRNHIYARVFDKRWAEENMPDAALRRERAAFRRGVWRTAAILGGILIVIVILFFRTNSAEHKAHQAQMNLSSELAKSHYQKSLDDLMLAQREFNDKNVIRAKELLDKCKERSNGAIAKRFEWRYLWSCCHMPSQIIANTTGRSLAMFTDREGRCGIVSDDGWIRTWETKTGKRIRSIKLFSIPKTAVFSVNGQFVIYADTSKRIVRAETQSGHPTNVFLDHKTNILSLTCTSNSAACVSTDSSGISIFHNISRNIQTSIHNTHDDDDRVKSLAISPNGRVIALGYAFSLDIDIVLVNHKKTYLLHTIKGKAGRPTVLQFDPAGRTLAIGRSSGAIELYNLSSNTIKSLALFHTTWVQELQFSQDGSKLISTSRDTTARVWDMSTLACLSWLRGHSATITSATFVPEDISQVITVSEDNTIRLWKMNSEHPQNLPSLNRSSYIGQWAIPGRSIVTEDRHGILSYWTLNSKSPNWQIQTKQKPYSPVFVSTTQSTIAVAQSNGEISIYSLSEGKIIRSIHTKSNLHLVVTVSPTGNEVATTNEDNSFDIICNKNLSSHYLPNIGSISILTYSPNERFLVVGSFTGNAIIYDTASMKIKYKIRIPGLSITSCSFTQDSRHMAVAGDIQSTLKCDMQSSAATIYDMNTFEIANSQEIKASASGGAIFTPDGQSLVLGAADGSIRFFDAITGSQILDFPSNGEPIRDLAFFNGDYSLGILSANGSAEFRRVADSY